VTQPATITAEGGHTSSRCILWTTQRLGGGTSRVWERRDVGLGMQIVCQGRGAGSNRCGPAPLMAALAPLVGGRGARSIHWGVPGRNGSTPARWEDARVVRHARREIVAQGGAVGAIVGTVMMTPEAPDTRRCRDARAYCLAGLCAGGL